MTIGNFLVGASWENIVGGLVGVIVLPLWNLGWRLCVVCVMTGAFIIQHIYRKEQSR